MIDIHATSLINFRWKNPAPEGQRIDPVIWISIKQLDAAWQQSGLYVGPGGTGAAIQGRYERFGIWVVAENRVIEMPTIGFDDGQIEFTDGRHRFAWLRDHGLSYMPVAVHSDSLAEVKVRFGARTETEI